MNKTYIINFYIFRIIPQLCCNQAREDVLTKRVIECTQNYVISVLKPTSNTNRSVEHRLLIDSLPSPYFELCHPLYHSEYRYEIEETLSTILVLLFENLSLYSSKYLYFGCCETLSALSEKYLTTVYPRAWDCTFDLKEVKRSEVKNSVARSETIDPLPGKLNLFCRYLIIY